MRIPVNAEALLRKFDNCAIKQGPMDEIELDAMANQTISIARVQRPTLDNLSTLPFLSKSAYIAGAVGVREPERVRRFE